MVAFAEGLARDCVGAKESEAGALPQAEGVLVGEGEGGGEPVDGAEGAGEALPDSEPRRESVGVAHALPEAEAQPLLLTDARGVAVSGVDTLPLPEGSGVLEALRLARRPLALF